MNKTLLKLESTSKEQTCILLIPSDMTFGAAIDCAHDLYRQLVDLAKDTADKERTPKEANED